MSDAQTTEGAEAGAGDEESTDVNAGAPVGTAAGETESAEPSSSGGAGTTAAEDSADEGSAEDAEASEAASSDEGVGEAGGDGAETGEADGGGGDGEGGEGGGRESDDGGQAVATATKAASEPDDPEKARLEEVGEHIRQAAQQAEEAIGEPGQKFYESGDERSESEDDQTIAPPG